MSQHEQEANVSASKQQGMSRRRFLSGSGKAMTTGAFVGSGALGTLLAACGGPTNSNGPVTVTYTFDAFTQLPIPRWSHRR